MLECVSIINFNVSDYALLYDQLFENFDNCSDEDIENDDNESEDESSSSDVECIILCGTKILK